MDWPSILSQLTSKVDLDRAAARAAMAEVMAGSATPAQVAALIVAWRMKGETTEEMTGMVEAIREAAVPVPVDPNGLIDVVGTGGDRVGTFNISTAAALVVAGAGAKVAKHGNRSMSSKCGSADVLEELGLVIDLPVESNLALLKETNFAFFFAPLYHPAFRHAGPVRRELGIRTIFNFLGPLANPAGALRQAIGVSDPQMAERMIGVLRELGSVHSFVFSGDGGVDEIVPTGPTLIYRLQDGEVTHAEFTPEDFGVKRIELSALAGGDAAENARILRSVLAGETGLRRDAVLVNAAPALVAAGLASGFAEGVELAGHSIDSGASQEVLERTTSRSRDLALT
ncbi:MAG: anthranilate phosphoribosyltransferase [Actinobacteria bacterium]|nr:anthranilate phosphoribosyltransferase [Actinomycetota bacterium]